MSRLRAPHGTAPPWPATGGGGLSALPRAPTDFWAPPVTIVVHSRLLHEDGCHRRGRVERLGGRGHSCKESFREQDAPIRKGKFKKVAKAAERDCRFRWRCMFPPAAVCAVCLFSLSLLVLNHPPPYRGMKITTVFKQHRCCRFSSMFRGGKWAACCWGRALLICW